MNKEVTMKKLAINGGKMLLYLFIAKIINGF